MWVVREKGTCWITSSEMKFVNRRAKYTCQVHKRSEDIISELKINSVVKAINNYTNEWLQHFLLMDRGRLCNLIIKYQSRGE